MYMCLYDLQKAFDSVEYPVLLERLYNAERAAEQKAAKRY